MNALEQSIPGSDLSAQDLATPLSAVRSVGMASIRDLPNDRCAQPITPCEQMAATKSSLSASMQQKAEIEPGSSQCLPASEALESLRQKFSDTVANEQVLRSQQLMLTNKGHERALNQIAVYEKNIATSEASWTNGFFEGEVRQEWRSSIDSERENQARYSARAQEMEERGKLVDEKKKQFAELSTSAEKMLSEGKETEANVTILKAQKLSDELAKLSVVSGFTKGDAAIESQQAKNLQHAADITLGQVEVIRSADTKVKKSLDDVAAVGVAIYCELNGEREASAAVYNLLSPEAKRIHAEVNAVANDVMTVGQILQLCSDGREKEAGEAYARLSPLCKEAHATVKSVATDLSLVWELHVNEKTDPQAAAASYGRLSANAKRAHGALDAFVVDCEKTWEVFINHRDGKDSASQAAYNSLSPAAKKFHASVALYAQDAITLKEGISAEREGQPKLAQELYQQLTPSIKDIFGTLRSVALDLGVFANSASEQAEFDRPAISISPGARLLRQQVTDFCRYHSLDTKAVELVTEIIPTKAREMNSELDKHSLF